MSRILVCGSRYLSDSWFSTIKNTLKNYPNSTIISGGCRGADSLAEQAAIQLEMKTEIYRADWKLGKKAGPIRNSRMLASGVDLVLVFHENLSQSKGSLDTIKKAEKMGIKVVVIGEMEV